MQMFRFVLTLWTVLFLVGSATAEDAATSPEQWGKLGSYGRYYQADAEATFEAEVYAVVKIPLPKSGRGYCMALQVMRDGTPCTVYLGPGSYVRRKGMLLEPGDVISVVGSEVVINGQEMVLARQLTRGEEVLTIRQQTGGHL